MVTYKFNEMFYLSITRHLLHLTHRSNHEENQIMCFTWSISSSMSTHWINVKSSFRVSFSCLRFGTPASTRLCCDLSRILDPIFNMFCSLLKEVNEIELEISIILYPKYEGIISVIYVSGVHDSPHCHKKLVVTDLVVVLRKHL